jgi:FG-GAP-like repeat/Abnormal spindle-like microcephaly-assoc'd, ASPM-SPD-2-Hydin/FG-GAP repeat
MSRTSACLKTPSLWLAAVLGLCSLASAQFETRGSFPALAGSGPVSIAVGDFNHDGKLDLAVVSFCCASSGVSILLGNGDGTFQRAVDYAAGDQPVSIVAVDLKHDGNLDLVVANSLSTYLSILLGNGDGTFQPATQSPPLLNEAAFVTAGDFNGDGKPDLVALGYNIISVLLGNGDGTFQNPIATQPSFSIESIGAGDFNRDGKRDLATAGTFGSNSSINILLGNGDGTFRYGASYPGETSPGSITVADFNDDHKLDLAIANSEGGSISVLLGNGDGTFQPAIDCLVPFPVFATAADMNGDHKPDLVVANGAFAPGAYVFMGNGDGTFQTPTFYPVGRQVSYVAVGDFNRDGRKDIAVADYLGYAAVVLLNTGAVTFSPTTPLAFNKQAVGTTSAAKTVTLTNTGKTALTMSAMKATGQFGMTSTCGTSVAAGANCGISVTFSPKTKGPKSGTVTLNDSASSKPQVIELSGTGT